MDRLLRCGGEKGIRTLERVLAVTRFPVVRLRPAQPSLQMLVRSIVTGALLLYPEWPFLSSIVLEIFGGIFPPENFYNIIDIFHNLLYSILCMKNG